MELMINVLNPYEIIIIIIFNCEANNDTICGLIDSADYWGE